MNRKLIRPNLSEYKEKPSRDRDRDRDRDSSKKKAQPSYETHAENYYYLKQMNKKVQMTVIFNDGEVIQGYIEWYDRDCIKLTRDGAQNLLIYKSSIKYLFKHEPDQPGSEKGPGPTDAKNQE
jgi:sRNA-binding regulator protein Hfq